MLVSFTNFANGKIPIYWAPKHNTHEAYVEPPVANWKLKGPLQLPNVARFCFLGAESAETDDIESDDYKDAESSTQKQFNWRLTGLYPSYSINFNTPPGYGWEIEGAFSVTGYFTIESVNAMIAKITDPDNNVIYRGEVWSAPFFSYGGARTIVWTLYNSDTNSATSSKWSVFATTPGPNIPPTMPPRCWTQGFHGNWFSEYPIGSDGTSYPPNSGIDLDGDNVTDDPDEFGCGPQPETP